jgi:acetyl esterase/lipase
MRKGDIASRGGAILAGMFVVFACATSNRPSRTNEDGVAVQTGVVYAMGGTKPLKMDIARPSSRQGGHPIVLFVHAGAFKEGNKESLNPTARMAAERGYVASTVEYRLTTPIVDGQSQNQFPAALHDIKSAVRWLRKNAGLYDGDPERIGAVGISAGGTLALLAAVTGPADGFEGDDGPYDVSAQVQAAVAAAPVVDFTDAGMNSAPVAIDALTRFFGGPLESHRSRYLEGSAIQYLDSADAPTLVIFGGLDSEVPWSQAEAFAQAAVRAKAPHRIHFVPWARHDFNDLASPSAYFPMWAFLDRHLGPD